MAVSLLWYGELCQLNVLAMHRQMASISSCCLFFNGGNLAVKNPCFFPCVRCIFHKYDMSIHKIQAPRAAFSEDILSTKVAFPPLGLPRSPWAGPCLQGCGSDWGSRIYPRAQCSGRGASFKSCWIHFVSTLNSLLYKCVNSGTCFLFHCPRFLCRVSSNC